MAVLHIYTIHIHTHVPRKLTNAIACSLHMCLYNFVFVLSIAWCKSVCGKILSDFDYWWNNCSYLTYVFSLRGFFNYAFFIYNRIHSIFLKCYCDMWYDRLCVFIVCDFEHLFISSNSSQIKFFEAILLFKKCYYKNSEWQIFCYTMLLNRNTLEEL